MDITAQDLWPLLLKMSPSERIRLAHLALRASGEGTTNGDADSYAQSPVGVDEFVCEGEDPLSWDAEGWEEFT